MGIVDGTTAEMISIIEKAVTEGKELWLICQAKADQPQAQSFSCFASLIKNFVTSTAVNLLVSIVSLDQGSN